MRKELIVDIFSLLLFSLMKTFFYSEIALFVIIAVLTLHRLIFKNPIDCKLFAVGTALGLIIEWYMGSFSRTQHWSNTLFLPIPIWLPLAWGYGFIIIHNIGKILDTRKVVNK